MNKIKIIVIEKQKINRWLAKQINKLEKLIFNWCPNKSQPCMAQLRETAKYLDIDVRTLITPIN